MRKKNKIIKIGAVVLLFVITIGYALLNADLSIIGTSSFARTTWNIHFENLHDNTNMTLGANDSAAAISQNKTNEVTYAVSFNEPGQFYEFTVDAKNDGTIDGMVNAVTSTIKIGNGEVTPITTSPSNLPAYMSYTATYSDGKPIEENHLLAANTKETYKVRVEFRTDIEASDLPETSQTIELTFGVEYVQKNSNAVSVDHSIIYYSANPYPGGTTTQTNTVWLFGPYPTNLEHFTTGSATGRNIYLKHKVENDEITEGYVEFVISDDFKEQLKNTNCVSGTAAEIEACEDKYDSLVNGVYSLRGLSTIDHNTWSSCNPDYIVDGDCISPYYASNVAIMRQAFGTLSNDNSVCYVDDGDTICELPGLYTETGDAGTVSVSSSTNGYHCYISGTGYTYC